MMIHKITPSEITITWKRFETQLNEPRNHNSIKVPKFFKQTNKKRLS